MTSSIIVIIYVDDILIYGKSVNEIDDFIQRMKTEDVAWTEKALLRDISG